MGHQLHFTVSWHLKQGAETKIGTYDWAYFSFFKIETLQSRRKASTKMSLDKSSGLSADLWGSFTSTANFFSRKYKFSNCFHWNNCGRDRWLVSKKVGPFRRRCYTSEYANQQSTGWEIGSQKIKIRQAVEQISSHMSGNKCLKDSKAMRHIKVNSCVSCHCGIFTGHELQR